MNTRRMPLAPRTLHQAPTISNASETDAAVLLETGLAADQAARRVRQVYWERRRDRLTRLIDVSRQTLGYGIAIGGSLLAVLAAGFIIALQFGLRDLSGVPLVGFGFTAVIVLAVLLLRTFISAVGEAFGRGLVRAARREGVDLPEVRFD